MVGFVSNDPHGEYEEDYGGGERWYGWLGGYIKFNNGIEAYSSFEGPDYRGIEVIGTHGVITNSNNTGLGLKLFKTDDDPRGKAPTFARSKGYSSRDRPGIEGATPRDGATPARL